MSHKEDLDDDELQQDEDDARRQVELHRLVQQAAAARRTVLAEEDGDEDEEDEDYPDEDDMDDDMDDDVDDRRAGRGRVDGSGGAGGPGSHPILDYVPWPSTSMSNSQFLFQHVHKKKNFFFALLRKHKQGSGRRSDVARVLQFCGGGSSGGGSSGGGSGLRA